MIEAISWVLGAVEAVILAVFRVTVLLLIAGLALAGSLVALVCFTVYAYAVSTGRILLVVFVSTGMAICLFFFVLFNILTTGSFWND